MSSISVLLVCLFAATDCFAQIERYELGKRLQRFERAWQDADEEKRAASAKPMVKAVNSFFSGQFAQAARQIDLSWHTVTDSQPDVFQKSALSFGCKFLPSIGDVEAAEIEIRVLPFYEMNELPITATVRWSLVEANDGKVLVSGEKKLSEILESGWTYPLAGLEQADYRVQAQVADGDRIVELAESSFSLVKNIDQRLTNLKQSLQDQKGQLDDSLYSTARDLLGVIRTMRSNEFLETDYPANQLLELAELIVADPEQARKQVAVQASKTDVWLTMAQGRKRVPLRARAPSETKAALPVLFLLHGAGGSENMFFETCGAGRCVSEGLERGWLVVAPRQRSGRLVLDCSELLDELEEFFPIDRSQVFLVGHSMGGGQVVRQVSRNPDLVSGAVVLGGGGRTSDPSTLTRTRWFVAAGELDFGRPGAAALSRRLQKSGAKVDYREFPNVEHMVIVQAAIDDLFQFLDRCNGDQE